MKTTNDKKPQTIESLKLHALKVSHRYQMAIAIIGCLVIGIIGGHFLSQNVTNQGISKGIEIVTTTAAVSKE